LKKLLENIFLRIKKSKISALSALSAPSFELRCMSQLKTENSYHTSNLHINSKGGVESAESADI
jgi:hypothetical protein